MKLLKTVKLALAAVTCSCFASDAVAQGAYLKLGAGFNIGTSFQAGRNSSSSSTSSSQGNFSSSGTSELVKINFGKGFNGGGAFGYMFTNNIGAELGVGYLVGGKNEEKFTNTHSSPGGNTSRSVEIESYSRMLLLQPSIVVSAGAEGINPYARFGMIAAKGTLVQKAEEMAKNGNITTNSETELELSGGWGMGLLGGLGAEFGTGSKLSFFTELTMSNLSYSPKKGAVTKHTVDGIDRLKDMPTREKEVEYVDKTEYNSASPNNNSEPDKLHKRNFPFSTVGIGAGIKFKF